jgi:Trk K+ transport system NAD-binding subunit
VVITSIQAPHAVVGRSALGLDLDGERRVVAVSRFGVPRVPDKSFTIQDGDILHFSIIRGGEAELKENLEQVGRPE